MLKTSGHLEEERSGKRNTCKGPEVGTALHILSRYSREVHVAGTEQARRRVTGDEVKEVMKDLIM